MAPENRKTAKTVAESPIQDVFEGRRPSEGEKEWAEKTLAPALEKAPERAIGAPTGTNLDEHGHARFTTVSGVPVRRLYTRADLPEDWSYEKYLGYPDRKSTRLNSSHMSISYAVFCLKKKKNT